jgi:hypothetical protein
MKGDKNEKSEKAIKSEKSSTAGLIEIQQKGVRILVHPTAVEDHMLLGWMPVHAEDLERIRMEAIKARREESIAAGGRYAVSGKLVKMKKIGAPRQIGPNKFAPGEVEFIEVNPNLAVVEAHKKAGCVIITEDDEDLADED